MPMRSVAALVLLAVAAPALLPAPAVAEDGLVTIERFVAHTSTVPANEGASRRRDKFVGVLHRMPPFMNCRL